MKVLNIDKHNEILALKEEIEMIEDYGVNNMNLEELQYLKKNEQRVSYIYELC